MSWIEMIGAIGKENFQCWTTSGRGKHKKTVVEILMKGVGESPSSTIDEVMSEKVLASRTCIKVFMPMWHDNLKEIG